MAIQVPPTHLVIFGRPGSGKSSLAERLGNDFGFDLVRTGELLRAAIRRKDFLGQRVEIHLASGNLVPDLLIFELLEQDLKAPGQKKLLFDGFPRTMGQVPLLEKFEKKLGFLIDAYLEIDVTREEAEARMTGRRVCPKCGATYHVRNKPPRVSEVCDLDGTRLESRKDDRPEIVAVRQEIYDEHAAPILEYYQEHDPEKVCKVDGAQPFDAVYEDACKAMGFPPGK